MIVRRAILIDIGDDVLNVVPKTPVTLRVSASVADDAAASGPAAPASFAAVTVADGVLLTWTAVPGLTYEVEAAPDVAGVPGAFSVLERDLVAALYLAGTTATALRWYRVRARNDAGVPGDYAGPASAVIRSSSALATGVAQAQASIAAEVTARTNADTALAGQISSLNTSVGQNAAAITAESTARTSADTALAGQISSLSTTVGGNTASITQQQQSINGLLAQVSVRLDVNGRVIGYTLNNTGAAGEMNIVADNFRLFDPPGETPVFEYREAAPGPGKSLRLPSFTFRALIRAEQSIFAQGGIDVTEFLHVRRQADGLIRQTLTEHAAHFSGPATVDGQHIVRAVQNATADANGNVLIPELTGHARLGSGGAALIQDLNAATANGWYAGLGMFNAPASNWMLGTVSSHHEGWLTQEFWHSTLGFDSPRFLRFRLNFVWTHWEIAARSHIESALIDTRHHNAAPGAFARRVVWDFKERWALGWPGVAQFGAVATISQWNDDSGGGDHQLVFDQSGRLFHRYGTRTFGWGAWRELNHSAGDNADFRGNLRDTPLNIQDDHYALSTGDRGGKVLKTQAIAVTYTIPAGLPSGMTVALRNRSAAGNITVARGGGVVLRLVGSGVDANRALTPWAEALLHHEGGDQWVISGMGVI